MTDDTPASVLRRRYIALRNEGYNHEFANFCKVAAVEIERLAAENKRLRADLIGYRDAFYEVAAMLGLTAMPISPKDAFETVLVPRLRALLERPADAGSGEGK